MSQFCKLRISLVVIYCILLSELLVVTEAHSRLQDIHLCSTLNVAHGLPFPNSSKITVTVSLIHTETGKRSVCYKANNSYNINMIASQTIMGLLMVQNGRIGHFPAGNGSLIPNFRFNLCGHEQPSVAQNCDKQPCNLGTELNFRYDSPRIERHTLQFRYSVVFSYKMFHQNVMVQFPPCPEPRICNASEFKVSEMTHRASRTCPNNTVKVIRHHIITENDIVYNCTIKNRLPIKMKTCSTGCKDSDGEVLCCRVRNVDIRMLNCTCIATSDNVPEDKKEIHRTVAMENMRRCECFHCKDVCPTETTTEDSNNDVDISRRDSSESESDENTATQKS